MGNNGHTVPGKGVPANRRQAGVTKSITVIPVIFIPGIAGTNLGIKDESKETVADALKWRTKGSIPNPWKPPNGLLEGKKLIDLWNNFGPRERQVLLNPLTTKAENHGFLELPPGKCPLRPTTKEGKDYRGWNSLHQSSYEYILQKLEIIFNPLIPYHELKEAVDPLDQLLPFEATILSSESIFNNIHFDTPNGQEKFKLNLNEIREVFQVSLPIFAYGYNWLESSIDSASKLLPLIDKIINQFNAAEPKGRFKCSKVILVTHSMGGLVGRAAIGLDKRKTIIGSVHTVMPFAGTPLAYRRLIAGTEDQIPKEAKHFRFYRNGLTVLLGRNQEETNAIMANSAGCLQLLPSVGYGSCWMKFIKGNLKHHGRIIDYLPKSDPYREIYRKKNIWYCPVQPEYVDPAGMFELNRAKGWQNYIECLDKALCLHELIASTTDSASYSIYGWNDQPTTFSNIHWVTNNYIDENHLLSAFYYSTSDDGCNRNCIVYLGKHKLQGPLFEFALQGPDSGGDKTVAPWSAKSISNLGSKHTIAWTTEVDHQFAFNNKSVLIFTVGSICNLVKKYLSEN